MELRENPILTMEVGSQGHFQGQTESRENNMHKLVELDEKQETEQIKDEEHVNCGKTTA